MSKYDSLLGDLKNQLSSAQNILIALPAQFTTDELAAGLTLLLSLNQVKKEVSIVTEGTIRVSEGNLFGVGQVQKTLPKTGGGDLVVALEGVVAADGSVPALEKLDWYPEGNSLNLVFHVLPGQRFEPTKITPKAMGSGFNVVFSIGATTLDALGGVYSNNTQVFSGTTVVNIDNNSSNTQYGQVNVVDPQASSVSEIVAQILPSLDLQIDGDAASNLLAGIYNATGNLTRRVTPETFIVSGQMMQAGGKIPNGGVTAPVQSGTPNQGQPNMRHQGQGQRPQQHQGPRPQQQQPRPQQQPQRVSQQPQQQQPQPQPVQQPEVPLNQIFGFPAPKETGAPQQGSAPQEGAASENTAANEPSPEEAPHGEQAYSSNPEVQNPEPDWLTPKIYKGGNIG